MAVSILVTGAGGGVGQSIIKSLQETEYRVVAANADVLGTGLHAVARSYTVPHASAPDYVDRLLEICQIEDCRLLFPGLDTELAVLAQSRERFEAAGTQVVVSTPEVVALADDKLETHDFVARHKFPAPATFPLTADITQHLTYPFILKPKTGGARSQGICVIREPGELAYRLETVDTHNYVAQEYIEGDEYTCGTVNLDGHCRGVIVMKRVLRDGDTYQAFVVRDPIIERCVEAAAETLKPFGACNFQLRLRDGVPFIFEINARCSGTTYCRTLAGFNEPRMIADYLVHGTQPTYNIEEITVLRYWKELVVRNDRIEALRHAGSIDGVPQCL